MIFEDPKRRRWKLTVAVFLLLSVFGTVLLALFIVSVIANPPLPSIQRLTKASRTALAIQKTAERLSASGTNIKARQRVSIQRHNLRSLNKAGTSSGAFLRLPKKGPIYVTSFLVQGDPQSVTSFKENQDKIDAVFPDWFFLTKRTCSVDERIDSEVQNLLKRADVSVLPRVTNGDGTSWHTNEIRALLRSVNERTCSAHLLASFSKRIDEEGLNVDIETIDRQDKDNFLEFLITLAGDLHAQGQLLTVDVTPNNPAYDIEQIGRIADAVVFMNYDEHYLTSPPGPIASEDWFDGNVSDAIARVPPNKAIIGIANYGNDWAANQPTQSLTFSDVMALADDTGAEPEMDTSNENMYFAYSDAQGVRHDVWFLNSITVWNQYLTVERSGALGMGLWRLGSEDPTIWQFIGNPGTAVSVLSTPAALRSILYLSDGEVFRLRSVPHAGTVDFTTETGGTVDWGQYAALPSGYLLERVGRKLGPRTLVLTFDDGPDPKWTPQILETLKELQVPATFFIVGQQAEQYPALVREMAAHGELVGNHTYLHPNIAEVSPERIRLELNSTQRVIESEYGRKTMLFRSPYDTDTNPSEPAQLDPLKVVGDLGYIIVGANIDAGDWQRPGVREIVSRVIEQAQNPVNHIIVLHDAGGDRSQTVAAIKLLIPALRTKGFSFVSLDEATGIPSSVLMPQLERSEVFLVFMNKIMHAVIDWGWLVIVWLFFLTTALAIGRIVFLGYLVLRSLWDESVPSDRSMASETVSIIIPAFNEAKTLARTIQSIEQSSHTRFELIVVDDGSTDDTVRVVQEFMARSPRIRLIRQSNVGKAAALNHGFRVAAHDIVVTLDADTILLPDSLASLIAPFQDPVVDAVCGNVEVGNVHNILTGFQALEYITTQNFDRRAFEELNCISVVPGATGAWRRKKVLALGGYEADTLTEDADLTLKLLRSGGKIVYAPAARSRTEAPATISSLSQQRFRWSFGTFQCLWKHRDMFFHGALGWVALPNMFFFQILFPVLSPIGDAVFLLSIIRGDIGAIAAGYVLFLFMDLCGSLLAFTLEHRPKRLMWLILIQRFFYRQFMYVITFRAILAILRGRKHGWNKLERKGTVTQHDSFAKIP